MNNSEDEKDQSNTGRNKDQTSAGRKKRSTANRAGGKTKDQRNTGSSESSGVNIAHEVSKLIAKRTPGEKKLAKADLSLEEESDAENSSAATSKDSRRGMTRTTYVPESPVYEPDKSEIEKREKQSDSESSYSRLGSNVSSPVHSPLRASLSEGEEEEGEINENPYSALTSEEFENQMILIQQFDREKEEVILRETPSIAHPPLTILAIYQYLYWI